MRLSELLSPARVLVPLRARDKAGVLRDLVDLMVGGGPRGPEVLAAILERERQFPTGIGYGVALPHGKTSALSALELVAGTAPVPVAYETVDTHPVQIFFLLAGPESLAAMHVQAIGRISRLARREPVRVQLLAAPTPEAFYRVLCDAEGASAV
jgi:PTS system nitrogen regulatory IIA component